MNEAADAAAEDFAERPRLGVTPHQRIPMKLGQLIVGGADAHIGFRGGLVDFFLMRRVHEIADERINHQIGPAFAQPIAGKDGLELADGRKRKQMAFDVVRLIDVRLDERDVSDARVSTKHVENRHPAAAGADLKQMDHRKPLRC